MKSKSLFLLIFLAIIFSGCNKQKVYFTQTHTFENQIWPRFEHLEFKVPITKPNNYDLVLEITHGKGIDYNVLPLHVIITTDDGEERIREFQLRLKDAIDFRGEVQENGTVIYKHVVRSNFSVANPTTYNVDIECFYPKYEIPYIHSLNLKLVATSPATKESK